MITLCYTSLIFFEEEKNKNNKILFLRDLQTMITALSSSCESTKGND